MIWWTLIYFVATLALSIALAPKPPKPKSAALTDFDFPTAEEGRPIPVVFGEVDVTGPNVLWYGGLKVEPIKKRAGFKKATVGYRYYIGFHLGLCHGPVDAITSLQWGDKEAWSGNLTASGSGNIDEPGLFGGVSRGGGVLGDFDVAMGDAAQTPNSYLTGILGAAIPAFRGVVSFIWRGGYIGTSEQVRPLSVRIRRILSGWEGSAWYPTKATINTVGMNPAHIIYQCLTDSNWGMGVATTRIDVASFEAAADALFAEGFGLQLIWNQSASIEQFVQIILDHIGGGLSFRLDSGLYSLTLFRGGYDPDDLAEYTAADISELSRFEKHGLGEIVNEVSLSYTDPDTRKAVTITGQDLANVESQGARIPAVLNLPGIRDHAIARIVLGRELAQRTMPLTRVTFTINRRAWHAAFGDLFRLTWPERKCEGRVFRVLNISRGTLQDGKIRIEAVEDIYQHSLGVGLDTQQRGGLIVPPATPPDDTSGDSVLSSTLTTPPATPSNGDAFFVPPDATGAWLGHSGEVAEWNETLGIWEFSPVPDGSIAFVEDSQLTIQVVDGIAASIFGSGATAVVAGGWAVDRGYLWEVKTSQLAVVPGGIWERRLRGRGVVADFRYISGDPNPTAVYRHNANSGELIDSVNTSGHVADVRHSQGDRYYYTCGIFEDLTPKSVVYRVDSFGASAFEVVDEYTDAGVVRFLSLEVLGDYVYAVGYVSATQTAIHKLNKSDLTYVASWTYTGAHRPQWLRADNVNLWGVPADVADEVRRINVADGSTDAGFTMSHSVGGGNMQSEIILDSVSGYYELWVSATADVVGGVAVLAAYRLDIPGAHGFKSRTFTLGQQIFSDIVKTTLSIDGELLSFGRGDAGVIVIALSDISVPTMGAIAQYDIVDRSQFNARASGFYSPAFVPQVDALPDASLPMDPDRTWVPVFQEIASRPTRVLAADLVDESRLLGATWVHGGSALSLPANDVIMRVPKSGTITVGSVATTGGPGSCEVDVLVSSSFPPGSGDTICGGNELAVSSGSSSVDTTLTSWTAAVNEGDWLAFRLNSTSNFTAIFVQLVLE